MLARIYTRADNSLEAAPVIIETHISRGMPACNIVGLPTASVKESKERVRSAIINSGFKFPNTRTTINLSPANIPKTGGGYDLGIALGMLIASGQLKPKINLTEFEFYAELALDGGLAEVKGIFPALLKATKENKKIIIANKYDSNFSLINKNNIFNAQHLLDVVAFLNQKGELSPIKNKKPKTYIPKTNLNEVKGQYQAKRALEIAACGGHNLLLSGTPGSGKTMLIERINTISPELNNDELVELGAIYSIAGINLDLTNKIKIIRAPHHSASNVAIIGGGSNPKPGEVSLAHHGVLFLDELPEFSRNTLEGLREPLESGKVHISRAKHSVIYPANFQLIAAMNPCPCGYFGDASNKCRCTVEQINKYQAKVSGPLLDRIDIKVGIKPIISQEEIFKQNTHNEDSSVIKERVLKAHQAQITRQGKTNAKLNNQELSSLIPLNRNQKELLATAIKRLGLSARGLHKVLRVARTVADLEGSTITKDKHLIEALNFHRG